MLSLLRGLGRATVIAFLVALGWPALAHAVQLNRVERQEIRAHPESLVLADSKPAVAALRRAGAVRIARTLPIWRVRSGAALGLSRWAELVEADRFIPTANHFSAGDPLLAGQWWVAAIRADAAEPPGPGKAVTVIDTGLDMTHEDFAGRPATRLLNSQAVSRGREEHGTAVASTIGAMANGRGVVGVYPQAALQMFDATPSGPGLRSSQVIFGIDTAVSTGPSVINLSLGSTNRDPLIEATINAAFARGSLVVAASGNDRHRGNVPEYPASFPHVLTVGAIDRSGRSAFFSGASSYVDLVAPGDEIPVAVPFLNSYDSYSGTSFAAPFAAAVTAWAWTLRPTLHVTQLFDLMRKSGQDIEAPGFDPLSGFGRLDVPSVLATRELPPDPREPNEDLLYVQPGRLLPQGQAPLTTPGRRNASLQARLDVAEDPRDVYRIWIPARHAAAISLRPSADVDMAVWGPRTVTVLEGGRARRRDLRALSERLGARRETARLRNTSRRGAYYYVEAYPGTGSPVVRTVGRLSYKLTVTTARLKHRRARR